MIEAGFDDVNARLGGRVAEELAGVFIEGGGGRDFEVGEGEVIIKDLTLLE